MRLDPPDALQRVRHEHGLEAKLPDAPYAYFKAVTAEALAQRPAGQADYSDSVTGF